MYCLLIMEIVVKLDQNKNSESNAIVFLNIWQISEFRKSVGFCWIRNPSHPSLPKTNFKDMEFKNHIYISQGSLKWDRLHIVYTSMIQLFYQERT